MDNVSKLIGKILLAVPIAVFGLFHLMSAKGMSGVVPAWLPFPVFWVILTGLIHIAFAVFLIGNLKFSTWVSFAMVFLLLFYALAIHLPFVIAKNDPQMAHMIGMLKDIALSGGVLFASAFAKK